MRILYSEENILDEVMIGSLEKAAELCVEKGGLPAENTEISLTFVSKEEIRELNNQYRGIDNHTDVLSFPLIEDFDEIVNLCNRLWLYFLNTKTYNSLF